VKLSAVRTNEGRLFQKVGGAAWEPTSIEYHPQKFPISFAFRC